MLRVLRLYLKVAIFQPGLREHAPHTTSVLKSCDFPAGAAGARSAYYVCTYKLRFSSRSCGSTLRILRLYSKSAIFQPELQEHAPRTTFVLKSCDFQAGAAADQGGIEPGTAGLRKQARKPRDNFQRPFREQENRTGPQRERCDTHDPRRGFIGLKTDSHGTTARAIRHARSPQRVHRAQDRFARDHSDSASTRTISAEGSPRSRHGAIARALRHARSPQRVRRGQDKFARRHSDSASTRGIPAEG